jgi:DNA-binding winged helix-turn-helix (wHTH) protein/TolB-like protein
LAEPRLHFGPFIYDPEQRALFRGDQLVPLGPKTIDLLHALLDERGRIVDKADLMRGVWPGTAVEEVGLARNVSLLRKALGDEAEAASYIETVPRRGYRFVAEVRTEPPAAVSSQTPRQSRRSFRILLAVPVTLTLVGLLVYWQFYAPGPYVPQGPGVYASVAVVPFEPIGPGSPEPGLSRGIEESLAAELAKLERVYVTSPGTVHRYHDKGIPVALMSRLLRLDAVLEGTVQRAGNQLRVTARMADVRSGKLIWAESYDFEPDNAQTEAASRIARGVAAHLQPRQ